LRIPNQWTDIHPEEWGDPKSEKRYQKIVNCLNNFSVGKDPDHNREAIQDWQSDLQCSKKNMVSNDYEYAAI
jgi:hypothetical protein